MSYKVDLSDLRRESDVSLTKQLVDRFASAIEAGVLDAGEKLPPTRRLAEEVGVNHLTAARAYRRLAELGYVSATVGKGTFVRSLAPAAAADGGDDWQIYALPRRELSYGEQVLADAFDLAGEKDIISLSTGWPAPETYPTEQLAAISAEVFEKEGAGALSYLTAEGLYPLREQLALRGQRLGYAEDAGEIVVTSGAQQAIHLVAETILEEGDVAAIESPTFVGMLSSFTATGARVMGVPVDEEGLDVDALEQVLQRHEVKLLGLQTACQNPTGRDLSPRRRERLAELVIERNLFVLEDRVYADLRFDSNESRPLRELAPGHVLYVNSLSKSVGGGLRLGWVAGRGPVIERIAHRKLDADFHTPSLVQHIAARYLASGAYDQHLKDTVPFYRERRDALIDALERHLPGEYKAEVPHGGHNVWVTLSRPVEERTLYSESIRQGVTFTPGGAMTAERRPQTAFRLSFSLLPPEQLDEGVRRLARALREVRRRARHSVAAPLS
jgi:DNA-binding transcriptional MocR family regulator